MILTLHMPAYAVYYVSSPTGLHGPFTSPAVARAIQERLDEC